jgi:polysaccharide deacetylase 2 family uncharacterized protein YibQ
MATIRRQSSPKRKTGTRQRPKALTKTRSRKRPVRKERKFSWSRLILIAFCLAAGFLIAHWISPPPPKAPVIPLSKKIHLADLAIKSQLYDLGLSEDNVIGRESGVRKRGAQQWTQTTTKIRLPRPIPFRRLFNQFHREIGNLGKDFLLIRRGDRGDVLELQVRVEDVVAHNLIFYEPKVVKPEIPLRGRIAIVIDDLGQDKRVAMDLLDLEVPLSFSVFPFAPYSREIATEASKKGRDVLLHLPMEPKGYPRQDPGMGRLLTTMGEKQLLAQLDKDLSAVPHAKGVNNHMGSKFTEDSELMRLVLGAIKSKGLFFLDSRTTPETIGFKVAREIGLKTGERNVFLDNERDVSKIRARISELIDLSRKNGGAIGIGHPHPETYQAIREILPSLRENGVELVPVSSLLE